MTIGALRSVAACKVHSHFEHTTEALLLWCGLCTPLSSGSLQTTAAVTAEPWSTPWITLYHFLSQSNSQTGSPETQGCSTLTKETPRHSLCIRFSRREIYVDFRMSMRFDKEWHLLIRQPLWELLLNVEKALLREACLFHVMFEKVCGVFKVTIPHYVTEYQSKRVTHLEARVPTMEKKSWDV